MGQGLPQVVVTGRVRQPRAAAAGGSGGRSGGRLRAAHSGLVSPVVFSR